MNMILDIFGSVVIAAMLFMLIVKLNFFSNQVSVSSDNELNLIRNTKTLSEILEYDLRKIGYKYDKSTGPAFLKADSTEIEFYSDLDTSGTVDIVRYFISDSIISNSTFNPRDIILNRTINNSNLISGPSLGLVKIKFTYMDKSQNTIPYNTQLDSIRYVKTEMWVESNDPVNDAYSDTSSYSVTYWEFTIHPRNI